MRMVLSRIDLAKAAATSVAETEELNQDMVSVTRRMMRKDDDTFSRLSIYTCSFLENWTAESTVHILLP